MCSAQTHQNCCTYTFVLGCAGIKIGVPKRLQLDVHAIKHIRIAMLPNLPRCPKKGKLAYVPPFSGFFCFCWCVFSAVSCFQVVDTSTDWCVMSHYSVFWFIFQLIHCFALRPPIVSRLSIGLNLCLVSFRHSETTHCDFRSRICSYLGLLSR